MKRHDIFIKFFICIALLANGQTAFSAVKEIIPNIEALWQQYSRRDADIVPVINYPYSHCFRSAARNNDIPLSLLLAVARGESNFNPRARSNRNCHGIMQIQWPGTAKHLGIFRLNALYEPCTNIRAGAKYLRELLDRYRGNLHLTLAAYNYGPSRIKKAGDSSRIPRGAKWYSGYIYHHLKHILRGTSSSKTRVTEASGVHEPRKRLALITFSRPWHANGYYQHLQKKVPSLDLDWYRIGMGRYQVVMLYSDRQSLQNGKKILRKHGVRAMTR
jgi:hypothetical protein